MDADEPLVAMGVALVAGLLIGLDREQSVSAEEREGGTFLGGARTYPLVALARAVPCSSLAPWARGSWSSPRRHGRLRGHLLLQRRPAGGRDRAHLGGHLHGGPPPRMLAASRDVIEPLGRRALRSLAAVVVAVLVSAKLLNPRVHPPRVAQDAFAVAQVPHRRGGVLPLLPDQTYGPLQVMNLLQVGTDDRAHRRHLHGRLPGRAASSGRGAARATGWSRPRLLDRRHPLLSRLARGDAALGLAACHHGGHRRLDDSWSGRVPHRGRRRAPAAPAVLAVPLGP